MNFKKLRRDLLFYLEDRGITRAALAEKIGITAPALGRFLNEETNEMRLRNVEKSCEVLNIPLVSYFDEDADGPKPITEKSELLLRLERATSGLSAKKLTAVLAFLNALKDDD